MKKILFLAVAIICGCSYTPKDGDDLYGHLIYTHIEKVSYVDDDISIVLDDLEKQWKRQSRCEFPKIIVHPGIGGLEPVTINAEYIPVDDLLMYVCKISNSSIEFPEYQMGIDFAYEGLDLLVTEWNDDIKNSLQLSPETNYFGVIDLPRNWKLDYEDGIPFAIRPKWVSTVLFYGSSNDIKFITQKLDLKEYDLRKRNHNQSTHSITASGGSE